jgi:hypothetical protein
MESTFAAGVRTRDERLHAGTSGTSVQSERGSEGERVGAAGLFVPRAKDALSPIRIFREAGRYRIWFGA